MAKPTENIKWATDAAALKQPYGEEKKKFGWIKLSDGYAEKPNLKIVNYLQNLIYRWLEYLTVSSAPVGTIIYSVLSEVQFSAVSPNGEWVLCDGRSITGSVYEEVTGVSTVPDKRSLYTTMTDVSITSSSYTILSDSVAQLPFDMYFDNAGNEVSWVQNWDFSNIKVKEHSQSAFNETPQLFPNQHYVGTGRAQRENSVPNVEIGVINSNNFHIVEAPPTGYTILGPDLATFRQEREDGIIPEFDSDYATILTDGNAVFYGNTGFISNDHVVTFSGANKITPSTSLSSSLIRSTEAVNRTISTPTRGRLRARSYGVSCYMRIN